MQSTADGLDTWEKSWAAYDETTYRAALGFLHSSDIVLDIGAGDLRFTRRLAKQVSHVFAVEMQPALLANQPPLPDNVTVICADARQIKWPTDVTVGVLLMRHCTQLGVYAARLRALGCQRLITNARWGMDVELVALGPRTNWNESIIGWYACLCGKTGFVSAPPQKLTKTHTEQITEVEHCPGCLHPAN